jgi:hypothetical protein
MKEIVILNILIINTLIVFSQGMERKYSDLEKFLIINTLNESIQITEIDKLDLVFSDDIKKPLVEKLQEFEYFDHLVDNYEVYKDNFKTIDLNNDGRLDIFYSGYLGGASDSYSFIFLNSGNGFIKAFSGDMGLFLFAGTQNNNLKGLIYCYEGPAADCPVLCRIDLIGFDNMETNVNNIVSFPNDSKIPGKYFDTSIDFKVKNEKYYLRSEPEIYNNDFGCGLTGNIHYTYTTGDKGIAYASEKDETGRIWYFVIMQNKIAGWMSSRYLDEQ